MKVYFFFVRVNFYEMVQHKFEVFDFSYWVFDCECTDECVPSFQFEEVLLCLRYQCVKS